MQFTRIKFFTALFLTLTLCLFPFTLVKASSPYTINHISDGNEVDFHPDFSPDGKQIVFSTRTEKKKGEGKFWDTSPYYLNLSIMESDGKNRRPLTSGKVMDFFPSFTPDGKKILFVSNREGGHWDVWSIGKNGSNLKRLTNDKDQDYSPRATPDGKNILFFSTPTESIYITESVYVMDMDGKNRRRLTSGGKGDWYPSMNPDGKEIVFASMRLVGGSLWTIDEEGKNYKRLTYGDKVEFFPHWSPDGSKIAYIAKDGKTTFEAFSPSEKDVLDIWVMDRNGNNKRQLTKNIAGGNWGSKFELANVIEFISYYHLSWHPDGTKIAMTTWDPNRKGSYLSILEFSEDTIESLPVVADKPVSQYTLIGEEEITSGYWEDFGPSFNPDGAIIAFSSDRTGNWDIWNVDIESKVLNQLTKSVDAEVAPVYSPDGKTIAFLRAKAGEEIKNGNALYSLWIMKSNGEGARRVTDGVPVLSYPAWDHDGGKISLISEGDKGLDIWTYNIADRSRKKIASIWETGKTEKVKEDYPFREFLYRVDYNTSGDKITFESNRAGNVDIWVMNTDGTNLARITRGELPHWNPVFSPDGKKIAYATEKFAHELGPPYWPNFNYNIWIADVETGEEVAVTGEEQTDWNPSWSPDGKKIAFVTNRSGNFEHTSIWMLYLK